MKSKALINFSQLNDGSFESKTHTIISNLTGNASYPTPDPTLAVVTAAADAYTAALVKAGSGNRSDVADKNAKREELTLLLRNLADYVNFCAKGDRSILLTSGYDITRDPQPTIITKPENPEVTNGSNSGQLQVRVKSVKGAKAYMFEYTTDDTMAAQSWYSTTSSAAKHLFDNLTPGQKYYCRVGAVGPYGQLVYSDAIARIVI